MSRNQNQWRSIADFLTRQNLRIVLQERQGAAEAGKRSAAAAAAQGAQLSTLPVGNHGEIVAKGVGV